MSLELSHLHGAHTTPISEHGTMGRGADSAHHDPSVSRLVPAMLALCATLLLTLISSPAVGAFATTAAPSTFSSTAGLPDGRVYEEVSPPNKNGFAAGVRIQNRQLYPVWGTAAKDGNAMLFYGNGPMGGASFSGLDNAFVATRTSGRGWSTRAAVPRHYAEIPNSALGFYDFSLTWIEASADLSHVLFSSYGAWVGPPDEIGHNVEGGQSPTNLYGNSNIFLAGPDPLVPVTWVGRPLLTPTEPLQLQEPIPLGGSPDLSTLYFASLAPLLPEDAARAATSVAWGLYEYRDGTLSEAGVLPDGSVDPGGAAPAATANFIGHARESFDHDNQVSADGSRAFFVSPDPLSVPSGEVPQLYVRKTAADGSQSTVLVSQSQLPGQVGQPAVDGPSIPGPSYSTPGSDRDTYFYASADGSHAFFTSVDRLTELAPENSEVKEYAFNVDTGALTYIPNVAGGIVEAAHDGSWFLFENSLVSPTELDRWTDGPNGGSVKPVAQLAGAQVHPVQLSSDGSVVVFASAAPIAGFNNGGGAANEVYRYDVPSDSLSCVSCPAAGGTPSGAHLTTLFEPEPFHDVGSNATTYGAGEPKDVSADGSRVFFSTADSLVPQDTNGIVDVYEWENGTVFLISSGADSEPTQLLDSSESGDDVFFATAQGLVSGDTDGGFDVYDARVPRLGDSPPVSAVPCQGDVCQGPPSVASLLGAPSSATFSGLGNPVPAESANAPAKPKVKVKAKPKCAKGKKLSHGKCVKVKSKKQTKAKRATTNGRAN